MTRPSKEVTISPRRRYPSYLRAAKWALLASFIRVVKTGGRPAIGSRWELVNTMLYVLRNGCVWRALPHDLPPWRTMYGIDPSHRGNLICCGPPSAHKRRWCSGMRKARPLMAVQRMPTQTMPIRNRTIRKPTRWTAAG